MFWQLIRENRHKSFFLLFAMACVLGALGYGVGEILAPGSGPFGLLIAFLIFLVQAFTSYFFGDAIMLGSANAVEVSHSIHPQLFNVVEEMKISAGLPIMPKVYIIADPALNAFATGVRLEKSAVAITAGLLNVLSRDELQGVIAHEISHIKNRDVLYMTLAGVMLGSIQMITDSIFRHGMRQTNPFKIRSRSQSSSGQEQLIFLLIAIALAILGPIIAQFFYFSLSRKREYLADAYAVRLTRYPEGLASALEKISFKSGIKEVSNVTAALFIETPKKAGVFTLFATHPPIDQRIRILRKMSGADFINYQKAFSEIRGKVGLVIPRQDLKETASIPLRSTSSASTSGPVGPEIIIPSEKTASLSKRQVLDLMRATNEFSFLPCECGLQLKVPPQLTRRDIKCPRCARRVKIPMALGAVVDQALAGLSTREEKEDKTPLRYERKINGWETFQCTCGKALQISPLFQGTRMECSACARTIQVIPVPDKTAA